jgi:tetratricopeptide (TPR) repeat protein
MFDDARGLLPVPGRHATWGSQAMLHAAVEGLYVLGERDETAALYPLVVETQRTGSLTTRAYDSRLTETLCGISAHAGRRYDVAEQHFTEAMRQATINPLAVEVADVRRFHAAMLAERDGSGDRDRARELLEEALEIYRGAGMVRHVEMAETGLKAL